MKAYRKNNASAKPSEKSYHDYLELYLRYKLKVQAAYDLKLDTSAAEVTELQNFRRQIVESYLNDEASLNKMVLQAFERSQIDIHLGEIFISSPPTASPADSLAAAKRVAQVYEALRKGMKFSDAAVTYSSDPNAKANLGDLGYITVFSLPYELEDLAYQTRPGQISKIYHSHAGYLIFKNFGQRKALGRIKVAQILLSFPIGASDQAKAVIKQRADSLYEVLRQGGNFAQLARIYSGDNLSYQLGGELPEFGVGKYDPVFEDTAFAFTKDGQISTPFLSAFGYHILKRLGRRPVSQKLDKGTADFLRQQVTSDPRIEVAKKDMQQKIYAFTQVKELPVNAKNLWAFTDSVLRGRKVTKYPGLELSSVLFSFPEKKIIVNDWVDYCKTVKKVPGPATQKSYPELFDKFRDNSVNEYYRNHLEQYNADFAYQVKEFKDGNLLFDVMQRMVWDKAASDSAGLMSYYQAHRSKYVWQPSADALVFTFQTEKAAEDLTEKLKMNISHWKRIVDSASNQAQADSGRFEITQLPMAEAGAQKTGQFTSLVKSPSDNTVTAAYILKIYPDREPRSFRDARGLVVNDYQNSLEESWVAKLKLTYPVRINQAVFASLPK